MARALFLVVALASIAGCRLHFDTTEETTGDASPLVPRTWSIEQAPTTARFFDLWGSAPDDLYAVGEAPFVFHSTGDGSWTPVSSGVLNTSLFGVRGSGPDDVWAVGNSDETGGYAIVHKTTGAWSAQVNTLPRTLNSLWSFGPSDIYAVGYEGSIAHSIGDGNWTLQTTNTVENILDIWASAPDDLYAVGSGGTILHSTGDGTWTPQAAGVSLTVVGIWGASATDIYAVGHQGMVLHSTGDGTWQPQPTGVAFNLFGIFGIGGELYASGAGSEILRSSGDGVWHVEDVGFGLTTLDVFWGVDPERIYAPSATGKILVGTR